MRRVKNTKKDEGVRGMTSQSKNDFSSGRRIHWRLWLAVLLLHALVITGLNAALTLNRLAAQAESSFEVAILPSDVAKPSVPKPEPEPAKPTDEPAKADAPIAAGVALSLPEAPPLATALIPVSHDLQGLRAIAPAPVLLRYILIKGNDSAKASLLWQPVNNTGPGTDTHYELVYEATYFGVSIVKQTSSGTLGAAGLMPARFGDKRRGKSEQATHFEREKNSVTFSNNRPEAKLVEGSQDRASFLIQLASFYAGQADKFKTGQIIELPVASVDELETWAFEVQASELVQLPIGEMQTIKLLRRPRRAFDITVELWLAPSLSYLPVRIRLTDSGGVTDSQLASQEQP